MKRQFVSKTNEKVVHDGYEFFAMNEKEVKELCPWASVIVLVKGGWMAWEANIDYKQDMNRIVTEFKPYSCP